MILARLTLLLCAASIAGCKGFGRGLSPVHLEPVATLGDTRGLGAMATTPTVGERNLRGYRVVIPAASAIGTLPLIFGDSGAFLGTLQGDGAHAGGTAVAMYSRIGPADSTWVFDNEGGVLVFDPDRHFVRGVTLASVPPDAIVLADSRILTSDDAGAIATLHDAQGGFVRRIGLPDSAARDTQAVRQFFPTHDGTFWTTTTARQWRIEHWDTSGVRLAMLDPDVPWFVTPPDGSPAPRIVAAWLDLHGRIWTVAAVIDRHRNKDTPSTDADRAYDTLVDVRDAVTGRAIASARFDNFYSSIAGPGVLVHVTHTRAGWQRAELARATLDDPSRP